MYGLPCYNEMDPTIFFGLSYMFLFGAMFGDLGQGFIILNAGLYLTYKKKRVNLGGVLSRLGGSSMVFGLLYGSVFGNEHLIPALFIRPMANINTMLILAVGVGIILMTISFIYNFINNWKRHNLEEAAGERRTGHFVLRVIALAVVNSVTGIFDIPLNALIIFMAVLLLLNVFKQLLPTSLRDLRSSMRGGGRLLYRGWLRCGRDMLSFLSNTLSFIRGRGLCP